MAVSAVIIDNRDNRVNKECRQMQSANIEAACRKLPEWEISEEFTLDENKFLFLHRAVKMQLLKKFSEKNSLEEYLLRTFDGRKQALMDLRIYKDSVYIVNLEIISNSAVSRKVNKLIKTACLRAIEGGMKKEVFISLPSGQKHKHRIKKVLLKCGFILEENQSSCEQKIFGETFKLFPENIRIS